MRHTLLGLLVFLLQLLQRARLLCEDFLAGTYLRQQFLLTGTGLHRLQFPLHPVQVGVHAVDDLPLLLDLGVDDEGGTAGGTQQLLDTHLAFVETGGQVVAYQEFYLYWFHLLTRVWCLATRSQGVLCFQLALEKAYNI